MIFFFLVGGGLTINITNKESGQNIQFLILPSTIASVDKGTYLHCYVEQVNMHVTPVQQIFT